MWVYVMISVKPAGWLSVCSKNFVAIFLNTINMIHVKLCMMVALTELYHTYYFQWPWLYFKATAVSNSFQLKMCFSYLIEFKLCVIVYAYLFIVYSCRSWIYINIFDVDRLSYLQKMLTLPFSLTLLKWDLWNFGWL